MLSSRASFQRINCGLILLSLFFTIGCAPNLFPIQTKDKGLTKFLNESGFLKDQYAGLMLFDPQVKESLFELFSDRYFTPASNTKIFTMYAAMKLLPEELTMYEKLQSGDTTFIRGNGNPALMNEEYNAYQPTFSADTKQKYYYVDEHFQDARYGAGWAWDDYPYGYQVEKSPMPIFANRVQVSMTNNILEVEPAYYASYFLPNNINSWPIFRDEAANSFYVDRDKMEGKSYRLPFVYGAYDQAKILSQSWGVDVRPFYQKIDSEAKFDSYGAVGLDTLLKKLMIPSDNFTAEQLLLMISHRHFDVMHTDSAIHLAQKQLFADAPDPLQWYDGSGLSRYNLFTPRTVVHTLDKILKELGPTSIPDFFPNGGVSGTIKNWYKNPNKEPYVFAKTGSLKNNHCLSGFIKTNSGRLLIFSMMNNNFYGSSRSPKEKMEKILAFIRDNY